MANEGLIFALMGGGGGGGSSGVSATVIADAFSTSKAYTTGEYVTRENKLYVFTADHAAGAWDASDVSEVSVGEELTDVKSAIHPSVITPASGSTFTLDPCPVTYDFGEMAELTVTVTADTQYHFAFESPANAACVLTMTGITGTCGDTVEAGKRYEVDIWAGVAVIIETEVTAV